MTVTAPPRFSLRVPETWFEFDVWRATRTGDLARLVEQRLQELPELRPHRKVLLRGLRDLAEEAERSGAVYCAAAADRLDDSQTVLTSLMVFSTDGMPEPALNTVEAIAAQIHTVPRTPGGTEWREVRLVRLEAGPAVRVRSLTRQTDNGSGTFALVSMQTLIPVPGTERVLNVVLSSPQDWLADSLLDLFEAISATLAWEEGPPAR